MKKTIEERKDIAFYIKLYPLKIHPEAYEKSKAIVCEKSLALLEAAHEKKPLPKPSCETTVIDENIKLAESQESPASHRLFYPTEGFSQDIEMPSLS